MHSSADGIARNQLDSWSLWPLPWPSRQLEINCRLCMQWLLIIHHNCLVVLHYLSKTLVIEEVLPIVVSELLTVSLRNRTAFIYVFHGAAIFAVLGIEHRFDSWPAQTNFCMLSCLWMFVVPSLFPTTNTSALLISVQSNVCDVVLYILFIYLPRLSVGIYNWCLLHKLFDDVSTMTLYVLKSSWA